MSSKQATENLRPKFHFTPAKNWINDPNGLIYLNGYYHLFFQYNPFGDQWGNISWGHARSMDLVHWEELPVAIPAGAEMIFSGTTVVDFKNTAGFGEGALIAIYTSFDYKTDENGEIIPLAQHQSLAYSLDEGLTFQKYAQNPILDIGSKEFRDPKVFWHEPSSKWILLVSLADQHKIAFYQSENLVEWEKTNEFGPLGNIDAVWECPDLFELPIKGTKQTKWILSLSTGSFYEGYIGMQYFIGSFDGKTFQEDDLAYPMYLDYGKDYYAGITFNNLPDKENAIMIAWASNHLYAKYMPVTPWRGAMAFPRILSLEIRNQNIYLIQKPISKSYFKAKLNLSYPPMIKSESLHFSNIGKSYFLSLRIRIITAQSIGINLLQSQNHKTAIYYNQKSKKFVFDRSVSGQVEFFEDFGTKDSFPLELEDNILQLDILVDQSIIEVFINDGLYTISQRVFPFEEGNDLSIFAESGNIELLEFEVKVPKV